MLLCAPSKPISLSSTSFKPLIKAVIPPVARLFGEAKDVAPGEAGDPGIEGGCSFDYKGGGRLIVDDVYCYTAGALGGDFYNDFFPGDATFLVVP